MLAQTVEGCVNNVYWVGRTVALSQYVLYTSYFQNGTHCTTGDNTGTFRSRLHVNLGSTVTAFTGYCMVVTVQINLNHVATCSFHSFLDSDWHFTRLATTEAYLTFTITNNSQSCETEDTTTFHHFGYTVDLYQLLDQAFVVAFIFTIISFAMMTTLRIPVRFHGLRRQEPSHDRDI